MSEWGDYRPDDVDPPDDDGTEWDPVYEKCQYDALCDAAAEAAVEIEAGRREVLAGTLYDLSAARYYCSGRPHRGHQLCIMTEGLQKMVSECRPASDYDDYSCYEFEQAAHDCVQAVRCAFDAQRRGNYYAWRWADIARERESFLTDGPTALRAIEREDDEFQVWVRQLITMTAGTMPRSVRPPPGLGDRYDIEGSVDGLLPPEGADVADMDRWADELAARVSDRALSVLAHAHDRLAEHLESLAADDERAADQHEAAAAQHDRDAEAADEPGAAAGHRTLAAVGRDIASAFRTRAAARGARAEEHRARARTLRTVAETSPLVTSPAILGHGPPADAGIIAGHLTRHGPPATTTAPSSAAVLALAA